METINCPLCGCEESSLHLIARDYVLHHKGEFRLVHCAGCGLVYVNPRPASGEIGRYYEGGYDNFRFDPDATPSPRHMRRFERTRRLLAAFRGYPAGGPVPSKMLNLPAYIAFCMKSRSCIYPGYRPGGRLLDIGCGAGKFLAEMRDLGWETLGIDISPEAADACRARRLEVFQGTLGDAGISDAAFDAVTMRHCIEHLPDPAGTLREVHRVLRPGGEVIVETPNISGLPARLLGRYWFGLEPPRHLVHFKPGTLKRALREAGFEHCRVRFKSSGFVIARSLELLAQQRDAAFCGWLSRRSFWKHIDLLLRGLRLSDEIVAFGSVRS